MIPENYTYKDTLKKYGDDTVSQRLTLRKPIMDIISKKYINEDYRDEFEVNLIRENKKLKVIIEFDIDG